MDAKQLSKIIKLYHFQTLKALWDGQGNIKVYYGTPRVKKKLSGKRYIINCHKGKGDPLCRDNYCGLKPLDQVLKSIERIIDSITRSQV